MDFRGVVEFFKDVSNYFIVIILVILVTIYVASLQQVIGPSMNPTLNDGDILILNKIQYKIFSVKRNDIVSFKYKNEKHLIKRVIGLPKETISYKNNILYIDGIKHEEIVKGLNTEDFELSDLGYDVIPDDMYLVLGDNREDSMDSRFFGLIPKKDIMGKVFIRIWPLPQIKIIK